MVLLIVALLGLYIRSGISLLNAWHASRADSAKVHALQSQNAGLKRQGAALHRPSSAEVQARKLGMAHAGEKTFLVGGLPPN
jgi:hypothetical protein